ncbi:MAG: sterol desaturase family protein [Halioglobus sp.]|nr:sterol desaturase family protein [Halioglobus sp.]
MQNLTADTLPLTGLLPLFLLALLIYGVAEFIYAHFRLGSAKTGEYSMSLKGLGFTALVGALAELLIGPVSKLLLAIWGARLSPFEAGLGPAAWIYGFFIYEMCYWLQHWLAHKVRLLWCLHSPHHAPRSINMFVGFNHSFLEILFYMPLTLGFIPALLGVHPAIIAVMTFIDIVWGNTLHISDKVVTRRWGFLEHFMQTPSYHRVHHARNIRYMDTNYNSITLLGDWLMGTLQPLDDREPVQFGITRKVNTASFWDVHFGEFKLLWQDLRHARRPREYFGYLFRPPGWTPQGEQQTAAARKFRALTENPHDPVQGS